jgi:hypothetical protein
VNPEQASKVVKRRTPTRLNNGEGSMGREETIISTGPVYRGSGDGTRERYLGQRGRPGLNGGSVSKRQVNWRSVQESERVIMCAGQR